MVWLIAVAVAFLAAQVALMGSLPLGWDESIYASQTDPRRPALEFTAPRARGMSWLAAPVQAVTGSIVALRIVLAVVSSAALFGAYALWLRLGARGSVPLAALGLTTLWVTIFYGPTLMPNVLVALAAVVATATLLGAALGRSGRALPWLGALAIAVATLARPGDVAPIGGGLALVVLAHRPWRTRAVALLGPLVAGGVAGALPWIVESELRYGGTLARVHRALSTQGTGERFVPDYQLRALDGPLLCRPCDRSANPIPPLGVVLWGVCLLLVALAVVLAVRRLLEEPALVVVPTVVGACCAVPYLFLVGYAAPRFLLPAYALLALPAAAAVCWVVAHASIPKGVSWLAIAIVAAGHIAVQQRWLAEVMAFERSSRDGWLAVSEALADHGVEPPCTLLGRLSAPVGYVSHCDNARVSMPGDEQFTDADLAERIRSEQVALVLRSGEAVPDVAAAWTPVPSTDLPPGWRVLIAPRPAG